MNLIKSSTFNRFVLEILTSKVARNRISVYVIAAGNIQTIHICAYGIQIAINTFSDLLAFFHRNLHQFQSHLIITYLNEIIIVEYFNNLRGIFSDDFTIWIHDPKWDYLNNLFLCVSRVFFAFDA